LFSFGGKFYIQCFHRDITEKQKSAQDKERLELQLQQSQRLESVGRLAGGVAHDFNNLLSVISGYSELGLFETHREDLLHDFFLNIHNSAVKSADLTKQLLAFARQQTTMPIVLDLNITITGMLKMLKRLIGENINLEWKASTDLWSVKIDPSQVDQILVNLCVNARDAILSEGTIIIEASNCVVVEHLDCIATDLAPDGYIKLTVSDNGGGIEKEVLEHIFEPFYTTKDIGKGTGLGLATIYGIVKQNQGFIDVSSEPGYGTKFIIYLPRCDSEPEAEQTGDNDLCFPTGNETILLVEDEFDILMMAKLILVKQGYVLLQANSPDEALRIVDEYHGTIHLLISDVIMPTMNGKDLAATLLALYPQIKSLFMSGYTADIIGKYGVLDEGINFIQKPFSIKELSTKVRHVLDA
jgi:nitrogen-specific signal transduction histidine kinase